MPGSTTSPPSPPSAPPVALQTIVGLTRQSTRAGLAMLWFKRGRVSAIITQSDDVYAPDESSVSALAETLEHLCEAEAKVLLASDLDADARFQAGANCCAGAQSLAAVPIRSAGKSTGGLAVLSGSRGAFSELDAATLQIVATWIGKSFDSLVTEWETNAGLISGKPALDRTVMPRSAPAGVMHPERQLAAALAIAGISPEAPASGPEVAVADAAHNAAVARETTPAKKVAAPPIPAHPAQAQPPPVPRPTRLVVPPQAPAGPSLPLSTAAASIGGVSELSEGRITREQQSTPASPPVAVVPSRIAAPPVPQKRSAPTAMAAPEASGGGVRPRGSTAPAFGPDTILGHWEQSAQQKQRGIKLLAASLLATSAVAASGWFLYIRLVQPASVPIAVLHPATQVQEAATHPASSPAVAAVPQMSPTSGGRPNARTRHVVRAKPATTSASSVPPPAPVPQALQLAPSTEKPINQSDPGPPQLAVAGGSQMPSLPSSGSIASPVATPRVANAVPAEVIAKVTPLYPPQARPMRTEGSVVLRVQITAEGRVGDVQVVSGPSVFRRSVIDAVRKWRYRPAQLDGKPVESSAEITLRFTVPH